MTYRTPRQLRWWLTIGINPQPRHEPRHYPARNTIIDEMRRIIDGLRPTEIPTMHPWQLDALAAHLVAHPTLTRFAHPSIRPGRPIDITTPRPRSYYEWSIDGLPNPVDALGVLGIPVRLDDRLPPDTIVFAQDPTTLRIDGPDA